MKTLRTLARIQLVALSDMANTVAYALREPPKPRSAAKPKTRPAFLDPENYS